MLYNYIKISSDKITKAKPLGYTIENIKTDPSYWNYYKTSKFLNRENNVDVEIKVSEGVTTVTNNYDVFLQGKSESAYNSNGDNIYEVHKAFNIDSKWDNAFPETIRLRYPGIETNNNSSSSLTISEEKNYSFRVWSDMSSGEIDRSIVMPDEGIMSVGVNSYFYDLISFIRLDKSSTSIPYEEWLKRPLLSLKTLLTKSIAVDGKMYQLYKVNDVNIQSMSSNFDEYIPWCFDDNGKKIEQHKIAMITSYNKKEIYLLLEVKNLDVRTIENDNVTSYEIPVIHNIVFWRSGQMGGTNRTYDIRNYDQTLITKDNVISSISDYFRESKIKTDTLINFQMDRQENSRNSENIFDNDVNPYSLDSNTNHAFDTTFTTRKVKDVMKKFLFGKWTKKTNSIITVNIVSADNIIISDHHKHKVHVFVNGYFVTNNNFYIKENRLNIALPGKPESAYVEIFISQHDSVEYSFDIKENLSVSVLSQSNLSNMLYQSGFLWNTKDYEKDYLHFSKNAQGVYVLTNLDNSGMTNISADDHIIIFGLNFDMDTLLSNNPNLGNVVEVKDIDDVDHPRSMDINYDPLVAKVSKDSTPNIVPNINTMDMWIFDNTKKLIKTFENEPYLVKENDNIKVLDIVDPNISLVSTADIMRLKSSIEREELYKDIISATESDYLQTHYRQMSRVNRNIYNMFLLGRGNRIGSPEWNDGHVVLTVGGKLKISGDYAIIWTESKSNPNVSDFTTVTVHKNNLYEYNGVINSVDMKIKPIVKYEGDKVYQVFILHRTDDKISDVYDYSFSKDVKYIMI